MTDRPPALVRAQEAFASKLGHTARWAGIAPGRVNLIGEHTDYNGGFVLPIAIDRTCVVAAAPAKDPNCWRAYAADLDGLCVYPRGRSLKELLNKPGYFARGSWESYVAGVVHFVGQDRREARNPLPDLDLVVASDVPFGSGLSSSASLEVAVAAAITHTVGGLGADRRPAALLCQRAEHEFAGVPCGIMDQFISALGQRDHALLIDCQVNQARPVKIPPEVTVVIANSGVRHALAGGEYAVRKAGCVAAAQKLGIKSLRSARLDMLELPTLTDRERRFARHVISEIERTQLAAAAIEGGDLPRFGELMSESHESLRDDYEVSCPELDTLVDLAEECPGVWGARMTGGGFGGCIVALAERDAVEGLATELKRGYKAAHARECEVFATTASDGARSIGL